MNACLYIGHQGNEWIWDILPDRSPCELPVAGKGWICSARPSLCSVL